LVSKEASKNVSKVLRDQLGLTCITPREADDLAPAAEESTRNCMKSAYDTCIFQDRCLKSSLIKLALIIKRLISKLFRFLQIPESPKSMLMFKKKKDLP
jgi:hypothetical protein